MDTVVEEAERASKSVNSVDTNNANPDLAKRKSGLSTKLEILQDFDEVTEDDLNDSSLVDNGAAETVDEDDDEIQLPIKLPPDLTIVKEVVPLDAAEATTPVTPVKRGRGRPRKNTVGVDTTITLQEDSPGPEPWKINLPARGRPRKSQVLPEITRPSRSKEQVITVTTPVQPVSPAKRGRPRKTPLAVPVAVVSKGGTEEAPVAVVKKVGAVKKSPLPTVIHTAAGDEFPCSLCPRVFASAFGRRIHESACRRNSDVPAPDSEPEEILPDIADPLAEEEREEVAVKKRRGRPPKTVQTSTSIIESAFKCDFCAKIFTTLPGLKRHEATCVRKLVEGASGDGNYQPSVPIYNKQLNQTQTPAVDNSTGDGDTEEGEDIKDPYKFEEGRCHCCGEDIETAHLGGEFECSDCEKLFRLKSSLERHRRVIHHEGLAFQCPECDARCPDKGTLARHMYTHTGLKPVSCPVCHTEFSRKYHLIRHNYQTGCDGSKKPNFPCQVCGRVFNRKDNLREHLRAHAGQTKRKKRYTCKECGQEFVGISVLNAHIRSHNPNSGDGDKPWGCDMCTKSFPSNSALQKHRRKHTGERPYECTFCFARFAAKETLNRHLRTHTGVKPHTCQFCGKGFIQASQLRAHVFHHSGSGVAGEGGFTCTQCDKSFNRKQRLMLHIKYVHEGAEPYRCGDCDKTFLRKEDLARHQLLHSGVKEHKCPICEKCFAMKSSLKIHLLTHTKEPPRSCDECGRAFIRQDCLLRHMRTKHRDMLEEIMAEAEKKKLQQQLLAAANQAALEVSVSGLGTDTASGNTPMDEATLGDSIKELLTLLVDETTLKAFGWPDSSVDKLLEAVIRRCGHQPAGFPDIAYADRLRENTKLLFTVVIDDNAVKTLLNNQTVDEVILHVLRLAKS